MRGFNRRRALGAAASASMLASLVLSSATGVFARAHQCDYTFPAEGGSVVDIPAGQTFCGGPGADFVSGTNSGTFYGGAGNDGVWINAGTFHGGVGRDSVLENNAGTFYGGEGDDQIALGSSGTNNGTFYGQGGNEFVNWNLGTIWGQDGDDTIVGQFGGSFHGGNGDDTVFSLSGGTCKSATGC